MDDKEQKFKTYRSLSDMHRFRLRLFAEGILTGIFAGIVISFSASPSRRWNTCAERSTTAYG